MPELIINGPAGRLEARYHHEAAHQQPDRADPASAPAVRRHDEQPGRLRLYYLFVERGFSVLRFNFRGVGRSQGYFDNGPGELSDAASALDWLQLQNPDCALLLDRRRLVRHLDRHAAADAAARDRRLHLRGAAGQPLRLLVPGAVPVVGPDGQRRQGPRRAVGLGRRAGGQDQGAEGRQDRARHRARRQPLLPGQDRGPDRRSSAATSTAHRRDGAAEREQRVESSSADARHRDRDLAAPQSRSGVRCDAAIPGDKAPG